jgi:hypothetical protein
MSKFVTRWIGIVLAGVFMSPAVAQQAQWTFIVYLAADNNLEPFGIEDFNEMETVGSSNDLNILVQIDRSPQYDNTNGDWADTRRYRIQQDNDLNAITSPVVQNLGEVNTGDPQALVDFINWAKQNYPAQRYCLVLWDHGGGWRNRVGNSKGLRVVDAPLPPGAGRLSGLIRTHQGRNSATRPSARNPFEAGWGPKKDVCYDDTDNDHLSSNEVAAALQSAGGAIDIVGYDACLMAMLENAYEIRSLAGYLVGSEELEPGEGWPYDLVLPPLKANPNMDAAAFARNIVQKYGEFYAGRSGSDQTLSALDLSQLNPVIDGVNGLASAVITDNTAWMQVQQAFGNTEDFNEKQHRDLYHFADNLGGLVGGAISSAADNLKNAITNLVIENYAETAHASSRGVAIYFPSAGAFDPKYGSGILQVDFPADTQWDEFLDAFYKGGTGQPAFDPYEPNDNYAQAYGPVVSGQTYEGFLTDSNDLDIYQIVTGSSFDLVIDLAVPADFDLYLTQINGNQVDTLAGSEELDTNPEHIELGNLPAGNYYILVYPYATGDGAYQLQVSIAGGEGDVSLTLGYDDDEPAFYIYSDRKDINEGFACYFRPPEAPATLKGFWYYIAAIDVEPGLGDDGTFWAYGSDYYGPLLADEYRAITPGGVGWNFVDLSADGITLYGDFYAGMFWDTFNTPGVGYDDQESNGINLIYTDVGGVLDWYLGAGTFFIRAEVSYTNVSTGVEETALLAPRTYSLSQNYPNPFNPETGIRYHLPVAGEVALKVYDLNGREVALIESGKKSAGEHFAVWNGKDASGTPAASGIYFYRLEAKSPTGAKTLLTKKMTLVK